MPNAIPKDVRELKIEELETASGGDAALFVAGALFGYTGNKIFDAVVPAILKAVDKSGR